MIGTSGWRFITSSSLPRNPFLKGRRSGNTRPASLLSNHRLQLSKYICSTPAGAPILSICILHGFSESETVGRLVVSDSFATPRDCSPPGSLDHGLLQAGILEWVAMPFSRGIFPTQGSNLGLLHCRQIRYHLSHQGSP